MKIHPVFGVSLIVIMGYSSYGCADDDEPMPVKKPMFFQAAPPPPPTVMGNSWQIRPPKTNPPAFVKPDPADLSNTGIEHIDVQESTLDGKPIVKAAPSTITPQEKNQTIEGPAILSDLVPKNPKITESSAPAKAPDPIPEPVAPPLPTWKLYEGENLVDVLARWSADEGYGFESNTSAHWRIHFDDQFQGDFKSAVEWLLSAFKDEAIHPTILRHSNKKLELIGESS